MQRCSCVRLDAVGWKGPFAQMSSCHGSMLAGSIDEDALAESRRIVGLQPLHEGSHSGSDCSLQVLASAKSSTMLCCMGLAPCEDCTVMQEYRKRLAIFEVFAKGVRDYYARIGDDPNAV